MAEKRTVDIQMIQIRTVVSPLGSMYTYKIQPFSIEVGFFTIIFIKV